MDSPTKQSICTRGNRRTGKEKWIVEGRNCRFGVVARRATRSSLKATNSTGKGRMEGDGHNFMRILQGSAGHMDSHQGGYDMSAFRGLQQGMPMQPPQSMPYLHPMMHAGGAFFVGCQGGQQYMPQQQQMEDNNSHSQPVQEENQNEDDVEVVTATQFQQIEAKRKGQSQRGPGFVADEDRILCSGWLNISKDAATGTNQDKEAFYKRLQRYYMDNYDPNSKRTANSIQKRWSTIQTRVSRFCAILSQIERLNQSGKNYHDMVNDAIKVFQEKEPWKFGHCWEMLKDEPKWNDKVLEVMQPTRVQNQQEADNDDAATRSDNDGTSFPNRPEGRDSAKKRRASRFQDTSSSSVAVDMLKKMNDRGEQMDEIDSKHKEELINIEKAKYHLAQQQLELKKDISQQSNMLTRELKEAELKVKKEMKDAELKVQMRSIDVEQTKLDTQIMFTDPSKLSEGLREWVLKRQRDIMIRDGVKPPGSASSTNDA